MTLDEGFILKLEFKWVGYLCDALFIYWKENLDGLLSGMGWNAAE